MRSPTRTRRLTIAAMLSLLAFVVVTGVGVRSFWICDSWEDTNGRSAVLYHGRVLYEHVFKQSPFPPSHSWAREYLIGPGADSVREVIGVKIIRRAGRFLHVTIPLWVPLLLLLIVPMRWLLARSANSPAFPVVTKQL